MSQPAPLAQPALIEQNQALACYLEALFSDKPMYLPVPVAPAPVLAAEVLARTVEPQVVAAPVAVETITDAVVIAPAPVETPSVTSAPADVAVTTVAVEAAVASAPAEAGVPQWGQAPFQSLLLKVQGLTLALPLVKLNRILPWREPTHLPGYVPWLLGVVRYLEQNVRVVDTAALVMPEIVQAQRSAPAADGACSGEVAARHIVLIGDGRWGLVCDEVSSVITIDPARVRWRSSRAKRPWLAGTVVEQLCALLDAERLGQLLDEGCPALAG